MSASTAKDTKTTTEPYNDWPNTAAFDLHQETTAPVEIKVKGQIPDYVCGVLYRTGPGGYKVATDKGSTYSFSHLFDGVGQTHRFQILPPSRVMYNSRHTCDALVEHIQKTGTIPPSFNFAQARDPCQSFWRKFLSAWKPATAEERAVLKSTTGVNVSVTVSTNFPGLQPTAKDGSQRSLYTKTDANIMQGLDPDTLEPVGIAQQRVLHPDLNGEMSAAHSQEDPETGDVFNYNLAFGRVPTYRIFKVSRETGKADILASITDAPAAYIHSFFLTKKYVVLCVFSAHYGLGGSKILYHKNMLDALDDVKPGRKAVWYVVDRHHGKGIVRKFESDPFFAFHSASAWDDGADVVAEAPIFPNIDILKKFYLNNLKGDSAEALKWIDTGRQKFARFRLPNVEAGSGVGVAEKVWEQSADVSVELPTMNPSYCTKPHRYTYGLTNRRKSTLLDGILKFDSQTQQSTLWEEHAHTPGEAIFVADPDGSAEDDGVLLSVVMNGRTQMSYLLVLDARTMLEVARAEMECPVPFGFHGEFVRGWEKL